MIAFVHNHKAFLPGLYAYTQFFSKYRIPYVVVGKNELSSTSRRVEWFFMGTDTSGPQQGIYKIHEYLSPSVPPFRKLKDLCKTLINSKPDFRIFQNEYARTSFGFSDKIPFGYRQEGLPASWLANRHFSDRKEYDFIYIGDLSASRQPFVLIDHFTRPPMREHSLILLGKDYGRLQKKYHRHPNIIFRGPVSRDEVRNYIQLSRFGINYIPDVAPFNQLPSTKFFEYAAGNIPVISSDYPWIRHFQQQYGGEYFYLKSDMSNFTWQHVNNFHYILPVLDEWSAEEQIRQSGVLAFLQSRFPEMRFD